MAYQYNATTEKEKPLRRPKYEQPRDLDNEQFIAAILPELNITKVPHFYGFDFFGNLDGETAILELKVRSKSFDTMRDGNLILSSRKYQACVTFPVPHKLLLVKTPEGLFYANMERDVLFLGDGVKKYPQLIIDGRKDRNDPQDIEPCVLFPKANFKQLYNSNQLQQLRVEYDKHSTTNAYHTDVATPYQRTSGGSVPSETLQRVRETADFGGSSALGRRIYGPSR